MDSSNVRNILLAIIGAAAAALAQVPAHATLLNPSGLSTLGGQLTVVHEADTLHEVHSVVTGILPSGARVFDLYYGRSVDAGRTWWTTEHLLGSSSMEPVVAADGSRVVALLFSHAHGPHIVSSFNDGASWGTPVPVSQQYVTPPGAWRHPQAKVHVAGNTVNVFWFASRASGLLWTNRSTDGGLTWLPTDIALDAGAYPDYGYATHIVEEGGLLHLLWGRVSGGVAATFRQTSSDGGATWLPAPPAVNTVLGRVHGTGSDLFQRSPIGLLYRSSNAGLSWTLSSGHGMSALCQVAMDGQVVLLGQHVLSTSNTVELTVSQDGGATWLPTPYVIPVTIVHSVRVLVHGDALFAVIRAYTGTWIVQSDDLGLNWRLVTGSTAVDELLWKSSAGVVATRFDSYHIQAYVLTGHTTRGIGTPGTGGIMPRLAGVGIPSVGRTFSLDVSDASPSSLGAVFASFAPASPTQLGTARIYVQPAIVPLVFVTSTNGDASRSVTVPASTAFAGLTLTSQALVIDANAADGFAATRAIETWIN